MSVFVIVPAVVTVVVGFLTLTELISLVDYFSSIEGSLTSLMALAAFPEFLAWRKRGFAGSAALEAGVTAQLVVLPTITVLVFTQTPSKFELVALTFMFVLLVLGRLWLHLRCIAVRQAQPAASASGASSSSMQTTFEDLEHGDPTTPTAPSIIDVLVGGLRYTAQLGTLVATLLVLAAGVAFTTDIEAAISHRWQPTPTTKSASAGAREATAKATASAVAAKNRPTPTQPPSGGATATAQELAQATDVARPVSVEQTSTAACAQIPSTPGVSRVTREEFEAYFQHSPIDERILGCPRGIAYVATQLGRVYWAIGYLASRAQSIIVSAPGYQYFVALGPAIEPIEELLRDGVALGAPRHFPRYYAENGSFYLLYSPGGSFLLEQETLNVGNNAVPYVELPPSVATATLSSYRQFGRWLWAREPRSISDGRQVFELVAPGNGSPRERIYYDTRSRTAYRGSRPWRYQADQENIDLESLRNFVSPISPSEETFEEDIARAER